MPGWNHDTHYYPRILAAAPPRCGRALEVGCGSGALCLELGRVADEVIGVDRDPAMIELARARAPSGDWRCVDFLDAELPSVDYVVFVASLHHMDMHAGIERALALLRPGGVLCVLGLARSTRPRDWLHDALGFVASRVLRAMREPAGKQGARIVSRVSYAQVEKLVRELPADYERLLLFRYLLVVRTAQ